MPGCRFGNAAKVVELTCEADSPLRIDSEWTDGVGHAVLDCSAVVASCFMDRQEASSYALRL